MSVKLAIRLSNAEHAELALAAQAAGRDVTAQAELHIRNALPGTPDRLLARARKDVARAPGD